MKEDPKWDHLLNKDRQRKSGKHSEDKRGPFERDYDRVIYSSYFRRLKDKTQVFPLNKDDFVRTRLSHSLEVSSFCRSFGVDVVRTLNNRRIADLTKREAEVASILSTVGLLHDIGNPPFGHFGEESIRSWFREYFATNGESSLTKPQVADLTNFEGNAQAFRVVTYLQALSDDKGLNLTFGTLSSLIKYPVDSVSINPSSGKAYSKNGYFQSEKEVFEEVHRRTGLSGYRHPLVFLMEASDDIAFSAIDVEDALRMHVVSYEEFRTFMESRLNEKEHESLLSKMETDKKRLSDKWEKQKASDIAITNFRINAGGVMFRSCVDEFINRYQEIMDFSFHGSLIESSSGAELYTALRDFARKYVYTHPSILELEMVGFKVIGGLMDFFIQAVNSDNRENGKTREGKLYQLLSPTLKGLISNYGKIDDQYQRFQMVVDYVSGLSDPYALSLYQKLSGIKLGHVAR